MSQPIQGYPQPGLIGRLTVLLARRKRTTDFLTDPRFPSVASSLRFWSSHLLSWFFLFCFSGFSGYRALWILLLTQLIFNHYFVLIISVSLSFHTRYSFFNLISSWVPLDFLPSSHLGSFLTPVLKLGLCKVYQVTEVLHIDPSTVFLHKSLRHLANRR